MQRANSLEKTLMLGKIEGKRRRGQQRTRWLDGTATSIEFEQVPGDGEGQGNLVCCSPWGHKELDTTEQLNKIFYFQIEVQPIDNIVSVSRSLRLFMFRLIHLEPSNFYVTWSKDTGSLFSIYSCHNIYWEGYLFPVQEPCYLYQNSISHVCGSLFLVH